jgi:hypothetical protein
MMSLSISRLLALIILVLSSTYSFAYTNADLSYSHLFEVNKEWAAHKNAAPIKTIRFQSDIERIAFHLNLVEKELRNNAPLGLNEEAFQNRIRLLNALKIYTHRMEFPTNLNHSERTPYFIDDFGVHCAVGYLIMTSGRSDLSNRIHDEHNYDYLRDIKTPGLAQWAQENGFTLSELAWIQPGYIISLPFSPVGNGTNDAVQIVCEDKTNNRLIYAGDFTEIDGGTICDGIGYYDLELGTMHCLGGGLIGIINDVNEYNGGIIVSGLLYNNGTNYSQAIYSNGSWNYINIPNREGLVAISSISDGVLFNREVVLKNDLGNDEYELWRVDNSNNWTLEALSYGIIQSMAIGDSHQAYGGFYDSLFTYSDNTMLYSKNACLREKSTGNWSALTGQVCASVKVVKWLNNTFFFGGKGQILQNPTKQIALSMIHNDTLAGLYSQTGFGTYMNLSPMFILDIEAVSSTELVVCGDNFVIGGMDYGLNLGVVNYSYFDQAAGVDLYNNIGVYSLGAPNGEVSNLAKVNSTLFLGGEFTESSYEYTGLNHLARLDEELNLVEDKISNFLVYPNPATNSVTIDSDIQFETIEVLDLEGSSLLKIKNPIGKIDISSLSTGMYFISAAQENGLVQTQRIVKN